MKEKHRVSKEKRESACRRALPMRPRKKEKKDGQVSRAPVHLSEKKEEVRLNFFIEKRAKRSRKFLAG